MRLATGVTGHEQAGGRWAVMWRERVEGPDGAIRSKQRKVTVADLTEARHLALAVEAALKARGYYDPVPSKPYRPVDEDLGAIFVAYGRWLREFQRRAPATLSSVAGCFGRFERGLRATANLTAEEVMPARLLTLPAYQASVAWLSGAGGYSGGTTYLTASTVMAAWSWASDQVASDGSPRWTTLPPAPRATRAALPPPAVYGPPSRVATYTEIDAVIRRIRSRRRDAEAATAAYQVSMIQRYTGLRQSQVVEIHVEDLDVKESTLLIRKGKSRREAGQQRVVALSGHLVNYLRDWMPPSGPLFERYRSSPRNLTRFVTRAWVQAEADGEVRSGILLPPGRSKASPTHAYRASLQQFLQDRGVPSYVIDHLVGHADRSTRAQHYAQVSLAQQRDAVALIPPFAPLGVAVSE